MPSRTFLACVLLLTREGNAAPTMEHRATSSKTIAEDLDGSASAYVYTQQQGLPVYYVHYTDHGSGRHYHTPVQYVVEAAAPVAHVPETAPLLLPYATAEDAQPLTHQGTANYGNEQSLEHAVAVVEAAPRAPYYVDGKITANEGNRREGTRKESAGEDHGNEESDEDDGDEEDEGGYHGNDDDGKIHGGSGGSVKPFAYSGGYGHEGIGKLQGDGSSSFEAGSGEKHQAEEYSQRGVKGEKGYEEQRKFSEGERGSDDKGREEGYYKNENGEKKGHVDEAEKHGSHEEEEKAKEGSSYGHSSYHKKGHKTNGFHNVYHKDEYKKETDFYDDDHKKGHFNEYEEFDNGYKTEEGGFKKGGHHSSGRDYQDRGKEGHYDKGHHENQDQGHQAEEAEKSYYANREDYGVEEGSKSARAHEFSKGDR